MTITWYLFYFQLSVYNTGNECYRYLHPFDPLWKPQNLVHTNIKGAFHQRRSNLCSAEPGSTLIVDLNQVQVMMCCTNVKLGSDDVVQLNRNGYTSWTLFGPIWSRSVTSHVLFTLVLIRKARVASSSERLQPPQRFFALILLLSHQSSRRRNLRVVR